MAKPRYWTHDVGAEVIITFHATEAMRDEIDAAATRSEISRSEFIRRAVEYLLLKINGGNDG
jgi:metal-responsive CopG/Arc/MetJ family transcriptional regulator